MRFKSYSLCRFCISQPYLAYAIVRYPSECCLSEKFFRHLLCQLVLLTDITYCESVFRKSFRENVEVFLSEGWHGTTLTFV